MTTAIGEVFTRMAMGYPLEYVRTQCSCGQEIEVLSSCTEPLCRACDRKRQDREVRDQARQRAAGITLESIPPRFRWASFDAPDLACRIRPRAMVDKARAAIDTIDGGRNIVLQSERAGDGKTSLATATLVALSAKRGKVGRFVTAFQLAEARRQNRLGNGEAGAIRDAIRASVLLLDEIAAEKSADTGVDEVIRARHDLERPTIFTCGFSRDEVATKYGAGVERRIFEGAIVLRLGAARP